MKMNEQIAGSFHSGARSDQNFRFADRKLGSVDRVLLQPLVRAGEVDHRRRILRLWRRHSCLCLRAANDQ